jgi:hypothetical protein
MFFQSQAAQVVSNAMRTAIKQADNSRKARAAKQLLMYQNEQEHFILEYFNRTFAFPEKRTPLSVNVVRKIIRLLAMVYCSDAKRTIEGTEQDKAIFAEIETTASLPTVMKQANRLSKLLGTILARPVWRNNKMELDLLPPDILDVTWGDTPHDLTEVCITRNDPAGQSTEVTFSRWTAQTFQRLDYRGQILEEYENPYARLPFIPIWSEPPLDSFWLPGANDLVMCQDAINQILSDLLYTLRLQSSSVFYIKGGGTIPNDKLTIGPGQILLLPEKADIGFASPNAPTNEALASVEALMKQAAMTNGLSAASVNLAPREESGRAKLVGNAELEEMRADDLALFARYEDQLFDTFRTVWNAHNPARQISQEAVLWCEFYRPEPTQTPLEKAQTWRNLLDLGIISPVDVVMVQNADLSREQAIEQLKQTQAEIKMFEELPSLANMFETAPIRR